jgi:hypothetical protein
VVGRNNVSDEVVVVQLEGLLLVQLLCKRRLDAPLPSLRCTRRALWIVTERKNK